MKMSATRFFTLVIMLLCLAFSVSVFADGPLEPPPPPGSHGSGENQSPLGSPIDGGLTIFLVFAAAYAGNEFLNRRNETQPDEKE